VGRDGTSAAVRTKPGESAAGALGTTSLRKQVGQSIGEPVAVESHVMCWPQTGQANLKELMERTCYRHDNRFPAHFNP
jgi:hypothetical protein